jgi:hypothetical protein
MNANFEFDPAECFIGVHWRKFAVAKARCHESAPQVIAEVMGFCQTPQAAREIMRLLHPARIILRLMRFFAAESR